MEGLGPGARVLRSPSLCSVRRGSQGECGKGGGRCPSDRQEARRLGVQTEARDFDATRGGKKVRFAPGREEAPQPRRTAPGRPPVPTHGLGQSLTGGDTTDSRRLRQRRGSGSSAGSCSCGRRAWSIPTPTLPLPARPPHPSAAATTAAAATAPTREREPARGNDAESENASTRPVATAAHHLRLPLTAQARGGAGRGRARRQGRDRTQKVWPRLGLAHPRGRRPSGLGRCEWRGRFQVSSSFPCLECGSPSASAPHLGSSAPRLVVALALVLFCLSIPSPWGSSVSRLFVPRAPCVLSP